MRTTLKTLIITTGLLATLLATPAAAQEYGATSPDSTARAGVESVVSGDSFTDTESHNGIATFDVAAAWRPSRRITVEGRPVITRAYDGTWHADIYQLAVRYDRPGDIRWRLEGGYLLSPVGILPLESRADQNPMIVPTASYTSFLPAFEGGTPPVQLASALYPLGAQATASAAHWDLRAGVLGSSPVRVRPLTGDRPPGAPQLALGGGVTPLTGLRVGGSFVYGRYARASEVAIPSTGDRMATVFGVDADYAFGFTRLYVDWMHNAYERADGNTIGTALTATAVQTLSPRWYVSGRVQRQTTSNRVEQQVVTYGYPGVQSHGTGSYAAYSPSGVSVLEWVDIGPADSLSIEAVAAFRISTDVTAKGGYLGYRYFGVSDLDHRAEFQIVWTRRWW